MMTLKKKKKLKNYIISSLIFQTTPKGEHTDNSNKKVEGENSHYTSNKDIVTEIEPDMMVYSMKSLINKGKLKEKIKPKDTESQKGENQEFTEEAFMKVWNELIDAYKKNNRRLISSSMELAKIERKENSAIFSVIFPTEGARQMFDQDILNILSKIRSQLKNFDINFETGVEETMEINKEFKTIDETIIDMRKAFPMMDEMIRKFRLRLKR